MKYVNELLKGEKQTNTYNIIPFSTHDSHGAFVDPQLTILLADLKNFLEAYRRDPTWEARAMMGVGPDATEKEINHKWKKGMLEIHTDKNLDNPKAAHEATIAYNIAKERLLGDVKANEQGTINMEPELGAGDFAKVESIKREKRSPQSIKPNHRDAKKQNRPKRNGNMVPTSLSFYTENHRRKMVDEKSKPASHLSTSKTALVLV